MNGFYVHVCCACTCMYGPHVDLGNKKKTQCRGAQEKGLPGRHLSDTEHPAPQLTWVHPRPCTAGSAENSHMPKSSSLLWFRDTEGDPALFNSQSSHWVGKRGTAESPLSTPLLEHVGLTLSSPEESVFLPPKGIASNSAIRETDRGLLQVLFRVLTLTQYALRTLRFHLQLSNAMGRGSVPASPEQGVGMACSRGQD